MKTLIVSATLATTLMATAVIAQTTAPTDRPATPPPAERQMAPPAGSTTTMPPAGATAPRATAPSTSTTANAAMSDWRASKLIGSAVYNQANERVGDINELLLDNTGKVARVVIGVGGFLGMGEHEVAVPFTDLRMAMDGSTMKISSNFTKQSLQALPRWTWDTTAPARR